MLAVLLAFPSSDIGQHLISVGRSVLCSVVILPCVPLAELYSYTEGPEFLLNRKCFEEDFRIHGETLPLELGLSGGTRRAGCAAAASDRW